MKFLNGKPALVLDELDKKTLVISDLHLGLEYEIYKKGISIPSMFEDQKKRILNLIESVDAERIFFLGDVKHNVPQISKSEKKGIPDFFQSICEKVDVRIAKGNHDGRIEDLLKKTCAKVSGPHGFTENIFYFNHGHSWPGEKVSKSKVLIRGHSHPAFEFKDKLGFSSVVPCWIKGPVKRDVVKERFGEKTELEEIVIVPAFNELISGMPVNQNEEKCLMGPTIENGIMDIDNSGVYLLDGTFIGRLEDL